MFTAVVAMFQCGSCTMNRLSETRVSFVYRGPPRYTLSTKITLFVVRVATKRLHCKLTTCGACAHSAAFFRYVLFADVGKSERTKQFSRHQPAVEVSRCFYGLFAFVCPVNT